MTTLDEISETFDDFRASGDTPIRLRFEDLWLDIASITRESDGTVTFELEEA